MIQVDRYKYDVNQQLYCSQLHVVTNTLSIVQPFDYHKSYCGTLKTVVLLTTTCSQIHRVYCPSVSLSQ